MSADRRLQKLEQQYGLDGQGSRSPVVRALNRVASGNARSSDFEVATEDCLGHWRAIIAVRSTYFRELRELGWMPWSAWPLDVASDIASYAPDEQVPDRLVKLAADLVDRPIADSLAGAFKSDTNGRAFMLEQWKMKNIVHLALFTPDDYPLRVGIAAGSWIGAAKFIKEETPYVEMLAVNRPACRPWLPIQGMEQQFVEPYGDWWPDFDVDWRTDEPEGEQPDGPDKSPTNTSG